MTDESTTEFERRARAVLSESLTRVDARTRSRLNQARHAALAQAARPRWMAWRGLRLMPATGAAAAALIVALMLYGHHPQPRLSAGENAQPLDMFDLVADDEALNLIEDGDHAFYEWAAAESDGPGGESSPAEAST